jgi:hypothetical protein
MPLTGLVQAGSFSVRVMARRKSQANALCHFLLDTGF